MAFEDGSDIITASIGSSGGWSEEAWSVVASRIVNVSAPRSQLPGHMHVSRPEDIYDRVHPGGLIDAGPSCTANL